MLDDACHLHKGVAQTCTRFTIVCARAAIFLQQGRGPAMAISSKVPLTGPPQGRGPAHGNQFKGSPHRPPVMQAGVPASRRSASAGAVRQASTPLPAPAAQQAPAACAARAAPAPRDAPAALYAPLSERERVSLMPGFVRQAAHEGRDWRAGLPAADVRRAACRADAFQVPGLRSAPRAACTMIICCKLQSAVHLQVHLASLAGYDPGALW